MNLSLEDFQSARSLRLKRYLEARENWPDRSVVKCDRRSFCGDLESELGNAGFVEVSEAFGDHAVAFFLCGARERQIPAHSARVALREGVLYVRVLQPALHYELEQISQARNPSKIEATLRWQNHPRHPFPGWVILVACEIKFEDEMRVPTDTF